MKTNNHYYSAFGTSFELTVNSPDDFGREVLKSDTAGIVIKEIELEVSENRSYG